MLLIGEWRVHVYSGKSGEQVGIHPILLIIIPDRIQICNKNLVKENIENDKTEIEINHENHQERQIKTDG